MVKPYIVKQTKSYQPINIKLAEERYNATYVGDFCIKTVRGNWAEEPVAIFYTAEPDTSKGHKHYFGLFVRQESIYITDGTSAFSEPIVGVVAPDGEVLYSRYRHDYREKDGVMIDGGRDYVRRSGHGRTVYVEVDGPDLVVVESIESTNPSFSETVFEGVPLSHQNEWTDGPSFVVDLTGTYDVADPDVHRAENTFDAVLFIATSPLNGTFKICGSAEDVEEIAKRFPTRDIRRLP